jgi:hypothetical protein
MPAFFNDLVTVTLAARPARGKRQQHLFFRINVRIDPDGFFFLFARLGKYFDAVNRMRPAAVAFITEKPLPGFSSDGAKTQSQQTQEAF